MMNCCSLIYFIFYRHRLIKTKTRGNKWWYGRLPCHVQENGRNEKEKRGRSTVLGRRNKTDESMVSNVNTEHEQQNYLNILKFSK